MKNKNKQTKQNRFKKSQARVLFGLTFGKNASATFISSEISFYVTIPLAL